jgi:hypothetical protein
MLQLLDFERLLFARAIPRGQKAFESMIFGKAANFLDKIMRENKESETMSDST